jgi:hypothetical protein
VFDVVDGAVGLGFEPGFGDDTGASHNGVQQAGM